MKTLLQINTSLFGNHGQSSQLAERFAADWRAENPGASVIHRDLAGEPVPHLTGETFQAFITKPAERSAEQQKAVAYSDSLIDELKQADVIALGLPMYNFGVPSTLKSYFDHVARAGVTFSYTEKGPAGLLKGKKAYIFATRGGLYLGTPRDTETTYVRDFLAFLGIENVEFVYAEGLALGDTQKQAALARAHQVIQQLHKPDLAFAA